MISKYSFTPANTLTHTISNDIHHRRKSQKRHYIPLSAKCIIKPFKRRPINRTIQEPVITRHLPVKHPDQSSTANKKQGILPEIPDPRKAPSVHDTHYREDHLQCINHIITLGFSSIIASIILPILLLTFPFKT